MNTLNEIINAVHQNAKDKGFHPEDQPIEVFVANQCNNMHAEITEFWDAWRAGTQDHLCDKAEKMIAMGLRPLTQKEEELADSAIRNFDVSKRLGIDLLEAVLIKHAYNKTRPHKHGKKN